MTIFNFNTNTITSNWKILDDVVMGGNSNGNFSVNNNGHGVFSGKISLENNGGFSSLRYEDIINVENYTKVKIKLKGDGKTYQFRLKAKKKDKHSYIIPFKTSGAWEMVIITLKDMYPTYRGKTLELPNFNKTAIEELAFLIGNKKEERFELLIDTIDLE